MIANIIITVTEWLIAKFGVEAWDWFETYKKVQQAKAQAKLDAQAISDAKTPQEALDALKKSIDDINSI